MNVLAALHPQLLKRSDLRSHTYLDLVEVELQAFVAKVDAELLKPIMQLKKRVDQTFNATICNLKKRDSLKPVESEDLEAGNVKDTDEDGLFLRKNI